MKISVIILLIFGALFNLVPVEGKTVLDNSFSNTRIYKISVDCVGYQELSSLKQTLEQNGLWWIELASELVVELDSSSLSILSNQGHKITSLYPSKLDVSQLIIFRSRHVGNVNQYGTILTSHYGYFIGIRHSSPRVYQSNHRSNFLEIPFKKNLILATQTCNELSIQKRLVPPTYVSDMVNLINQSMWSQNLQTLATFNRYIGSSTMPNAEAFIASKLQGLPGIVISNQTFTVSGTTCFNIIGTLTGTTDPDKWIIVGAHYDSTSQAVATAAPGAEDNGSGTVSVLEMARIFSANPPGITMIFILYSGEEEGLFGSIAHSQRIIDQGDKSKVLLAHTMDMVSYRAPSSASEVVLLESSEIFQYPFPTYTSMASMYSQNGLTTVTSQHPFGSDHVPYIDRNIPALLVIDNDWDDYPDYHRTTDTYNKINLPIAMDILRMNVAAVATFATGNLTVPASAITTSFAQVHSPQWITLIISITLAVFAFTF